MYFQNDSKNRPVSIIITTLAARAYGDQADLYDALVSVATEMHNYIERRPDGKWWVPNPVDPDENFADKWNEYPKRREAFFLWLEQVRDDFVSAAQHRTLSKSAGALSPILGRSAVSRAASSLGIQPSSLQTLTSVGSAVSVPALADVSHCVAPPWPTRLQYQVGIKGSVHAAFRSGKKLWAMTKRPVPRGVWLRFEVTTNIPEPYEVRWQIVNTGRDAILAGGLRGDEFEPSNGRSKNVRWETTEYRGTHWIEAFIIRHDVCVARSKPFMVRIRS